MRLMIISGGSRGLGEKITKIYNRENYKVIELSRSGRGKNHLNCDLSSFQSSQSIINELFSELSEQVWEEVILINNAALLGPIKKSYHLEEKDIEKSLTVNILSSLGLISNFCRLFKKNHSRKVILNVSSGAARHPYASWSLYCSSKAAMEMFIKTLALEQEGELDPFIPVNYNPGIMDTDMQKEIRQSDVNEFPLREKFIEYKNDGSLNKAEYVAMDINRLLKGELISGETYAVAKESV